MYEQRQVHAHTTPFVKCEKWDWKNGDYYSPFGDKVTCPDCIARGVPEFTYPKSQNEDRQNKAEGKYVLPYDMFCYGNPLYADCHMAGSCRRRNRSCSE